MNRLGVGYGCGLVIMQKSPRKTFYTILLSVTRLIYYLYHLKKNYI